jgi:hypothetical protein
MGRFLCLIMASTLLADVELQQTECILFWAL